MAKGFSATTVKSWFQYRCERKVRYELSSDDELASVPVVKDVREQSWAILGKKFEDGLVDALGQAVLKPRRDERVLSESLSAAFLKGQRPERYAAQVNLFPKNAAAFLQGTGLFLNRNIADLLRIDLSSSKPGSRELTIIDIKATRHATAFHKAQVAFYVRVLEEVIREMKLSDLTISDHGEIWRIADRATAESREFDVDRFALTPYLRLVDDFCANVLPDIANKKLGNGFDETFFHLYFKCEQCSFLEHCRRSIGPERVRASRDISAVAGLTHEAKRALNRRSIFNVGQLAAAEGLGRMPGLSWSLSKRAPLLVTRAKSLATEEILRTEDEHTYLMPGKIDCALLISVDHDPVDDRVAALGYARIDSGKRARQASIVVPRSGGLEDERNALTAVLSELILDLSQIDEHNLAIEEGRSQADPLFAHIFLYEPSEAINLQAAIGRHLDSEAIRNGLLNLVRLFPPEDVVPEPEFRGVHHLPATALRSVIEQLFALPVAVAYDLRQVSQAILGSESNAYAPGPDFERPFSSLLSIEVIRGLRENSPKAQSRQAIVEDVNARLVAMQELIAWLVEKDSSAAQKGASLLRLAKRPFRFQASFDPLNAMDLDVLLACELLENRAGLLEALINLAKPFQRRRDSGRSLVKIHRDRDFKGSQWGSRRFIFHVPSESREAELSSGDMDLILHNDAPDLRLNPSMWQEISCRIVDLDPPLPVNQICVEVRKQVLDSQTFQSLLDRTPDDGWFIDKAFFDVNSQRAAAFISYLGREVSA
ncbi:hypothetical protein HFO69_26210 [Rhizobium laguerreae]|uniref:hypothetical protein n=1 Tax=Rhizobium laguerreae TaxID=1076926 RepID=UPI001C8FED8E|nr:hypothetical protein [Rhizobium laguerreae]MBY3101164.1 hypothetical protein [Rhizobium laguerreae]